MFEIVVKNTALFLLIILILHFMINNLLITDLNYLELMVLYQMLLRMELRTKSVK